MISCSSITLPDIKNMGKPRLLYTPEFSQNNVLASVEYSSVYSRFGGRYSGFATSRISRWYYHWYWVISNRHYSELYYLIGTRTCTRVVHEYKRTRKQCTRTCILVLGPWVLSYMVRVQVLTHWFSFFCVFTHTSNYDGIVQINATRFHVLLLSALCL